MYPPVNVSPVEELLTEVYSPANLAHDLDEIAFDYARILVEVYLLDESESIFINRRAGDFISTLRDLSEAIRECKIKQ